MPLPSKATASPSISTAGSSRAAGPPADRDVEDGPAEPEPAERLRDELPEPRRGGSSERRQLDGAIRDRGQEARIVVGPASPFGLDAAEADRLGGGLLAVRDDRRFVVAVAALEGVDQRQPLFHSRQLAGVVLDPVDHCARLFGDVAQLGLEAGQPLGQWPEPRVEAIELADASQGLGDSLAGPAGIADERFAELRAGPGDRLAVLGGLEAHPDLLRFAGPKASGQDLGRLVLVHRELAGHLARIERELGQDGAVRPPLLDGLGHACPRVCMPAERVEEVALGPLVEQALLLVLAVNLDQRPRCLGQSSRGHVLVVEPGRGAAGRRDLADGNQGLRRAVEEGLDPGDVGAVADERRIGTGADGEPQGVDEEALAGSRSPRSGR